MHTFRPRHGGVLYEVGTMESSGAFVPLFKVMGLKYAILAVNKLNGGVGSFEF